MTELQPRRYKACRTCRRQKMRCDGCQNVPCRRCVSAKVECVFDHAQGRFTRSPGRTSLQAKSWNLQTLDLEIFTDNPPNPRQALSTGNTPSCERQTGGGEQRNVVQSDRAEGIDIDELESWSSPRGQWDQQDSANAAPHGGNIQSSFLRSINLPRDDNEVSCHSLSSENLSIPVTAVHVLMYKRRANELDRNGSNWTVENQSEWNREDNSELHSGGDLITRGLIHEDQARRLFEQFMQGCNFFLPIYEPLVDTFDSVRERSTFAWTVIIFVAARVQVVEQPGTAEVYQFCKEEVRRLAADTLFANPASLDSTEAMAILAIQSDKNWFAIGHALQMAKDLHLDRSLRGSYAESLPTSQSGISTRKGRYDARCVRACLMISQFERAVALGTCRQARSAVYDTKTLESFLAQGFSRPSDVYFCSAVDLFQMCEQYQTNATPPTVEQITSDLEIWWRKWDKFYLTDHIHTGSFQRVHLKSQMFQAKIVQAGSLFTGMRLPWSAEESRKQMTPDEAEHIGKHTLQTINDFLIFIDESHAYKWVFKWAPTYDALLLAFIAVFALKLLSLYPGSTARDSTMDMIDKTANLLKQHPCQSFYNLVKRLLDQGKSSIDTLERNFVETTMNYDNIDVQQDLFDFTNWPMFRNEF